MRGRAGTTPDGPGWRRGSVCTMALLALAVDVLVALPERRGVVGLERPDRAEGEGEVDGPGDVLAHHRGLDRGARSRADREDPVRAHQHRRRAVPGERVDDAAADLLVADERERPDGDLAAELVRHRGHDA